MQDAVNVCWAYTLNALDFASMPARVILGGDSLSEPVFDKATGEQVGERPVNLDKQVMERIMQITGDNVSIGEWTASNLQAFLPIIQKAVEHIAAETRTPGHYLLTNAEVPATGYEVAEAGLVSKTLERISFMRQPVRELCRDGHDARGRRAVSAHPRGLQGRVRHAAVPQRGPHGRRDAQIQAARLPAAVDRRTDGPEPRGHQAHHAHDRRGEQRPGDGRDSANPAGRRCI